MKYEHFLNRYSLYDSSGTTRLICIPLWATAHRDSFCRFYFLPKIASYFLPVSHEKDWTLKQPHHKSCEIGIDIPTASHGMVILDL